MRLPKFSLILTCGIVTALALPYGAFAATLSLLPAEKTAAVGDTFTVTLMVSSVDQAMNAASADILFPSNKLRALSVSNVGSVMGLWVQDPAISNAQSGGTVSFAGIALNPGYTGGAGTIIKIRFQALAPGTAMLSFTSASVLANDGKGTNILNTTLPASVTIVPASRPAPVPATPAPVATSTPETVATSTPEEPTPVTPAPVAPVVAATKTTSVLDWLPGSAGFIFGVGVLILLLIGMLGSIFAAGYYIVFFLRRLRLMLNRQLLHEQERLRNELNEARRALPPPLPPAPAPEPVPTEPLFVPSTHRPPSPSSHSSVSHSGPMAVPPPARLRPRMASPIIDQSHDDNEYDEVLSPSQPAAPVTTPAAPVKPAGPPPLQHELDLRNLK